MSEVDQRRLYGAAFIACATAWALLSAPWLDGNLTIPYDAKAHFQAQIQFLSNALHSGQSPFWTPNVFGGSPQIADPQSLIFSPAFFIAYFNQAPSFSTVDAYVLGLLGAGGLGIFLFFRDRGWHAAGAIVAVLSFTFGASAAWRIQHVGQIQSYAFFALSLWLLARMLDRRSILWGIAAGFVSGLMIVKPDQVAFLACYVLAGYVLDHVLRSRFRLTAMRELALPITAASLTGLAVAGIPLVLTYLFVESSSRPAIAFNDAVHGSLHPASLLTAVIGDLYGALDPKVTYWGPSSMSWNPNELSLSQNMSQLYVGAIPVLLLLTVGIVRRQAWVTEIRFFSIALIISLLYALGAFTPAFQIIYDFVPGVDLFRRPADATFLIGGLLAIVGGYLMHRIAAGLIPRASRVQQAIEHAIIGLTLAVGFLVAFRLGHLNDATKPLVVALVCLIASGALIAVMGRVSSRHALACLSGVAALMTADLAVNNGPNESTALPIAQYEILKPNCQNETIRLLKAKLKQPPGSPRRDRVELVGLGFEWPNASMIHGFDNLLGYNPLRLDIVSKAVGADDTAAGWDQRRFTPLFPSYRSVLADMLGLRYIASGVPIEKIDKKLKPGDLIPIARTKDGYVYENPRALPRVMFVENWQLADFGALVETGEWPQLDPTKTLLLESPPPTLPKRIVPSGLEIAKVSYSDEPATSVVTVPRYENTVMEIDVTAQRDGFVLVNSVWHPWWRATIDGAPAEILKANVMFRAVQVTAGRHRVRFEFDPFTGAISQIEHPSKTKSQVVSRRKSNPRRPHV